MTKSLQILFLIFFSQILLANGGEQRLSKKNIVSIFNGEHQTLLFNDSSGNIFTYNGNRINSLPFENNVDTPTRILISNSTFKLFVSGTSVFKLPKNGVKSEVLTISDQEKIFKASYDSKNFYLSTDDGLYIIDKKTNNNRKIFESDISNVKEIICGSEKCYLALKNLVITPGEQNNVVAEMNSNVLELSSTDNGQLLILCEDGLYVLKEGSTKQLVPSSGSMPKELISIRNSKRWLYLIKDQSVFAFDWINSEILNLGNYSGQLACSEIDHWSNLWLASSQGVWNFGAANEFEAPRIYGHKFTNSKNQEIDPSAYEFSNTNTLLNVQPELSYLPNQEQIITEWKTESGNWNPFEKDFVLSKSDLKGNKNKILIRAKASNSDYTLPYTFNVKSAPTNETPSFWYLIFAVLGGLLLIALLSLFNLRSKQNEADLQIRQLKTQNELLQSKQQIDQLKMNPHFIFNALTSINGLIASGDIKKGRKAISMFSKFLRQFLNQSQEETISLEDEQELLSNYVNIELMCREDSFDFLIEEINADLSDVKIPNMIVQPFIENAIIHAFGNLDRRGKISLRFEESDGYLVALIEDNGVGMGKAKKQESNHKSIAIDLVKQRLSQRDKNFRKDYVDYSNLNPGTSVKVYLRRI